MSDLGMVNLHYHVAGCHLRVGEDAVQGIDRARGDTRLGQEPQPLLTGPGAEWLRLLAEAGIPSGPINTLDRVFADPQVAARNMVVEIDHPKVGRFRSIGNPVKTPLMPEGPFEPPPMHGQHTEEVLREVLGYSREQIRELVEKVVIKE